MSVEASRRYREKKKEREIKFENELKKINKINNNLFRKYKLLLKTKQAIVDYLIQNYADKIKIVDGPLMSLAEIPSMNCLTNENNQQLSNISDSPMTLLSSNESEIKSVCVDDQVEKPIFDYNSLCSSELELLSLSMDFSNFQFENCDFQNVPLAQKLNINQCPSQEFNDELMLVDEFSTFVGLYENKCFNLEFYDEQMNETIPNGELPFLGEMVEATNIDFLKDLYA